jgi:C4-dicarboxylate-specific signal transduction histidine kinase
MSKKVSQNGFDRIPLRLHPRVFAALGADLVTNDVVAVIELVKNSYDAFANNVWIRFCEDEDNGTYLEIEDDGCGMSKKIIEDVWCLVATPYKEQHPKATSGKKSRRVVGEKGLGRLSASRLGKRLNMLTQSQDSPCWELNANWSNISKGDDLSECFVECRKYPEVSPFGTSGTLLRIYDLKTAWDESSISDLEDNLARLVSPFSEVGDFNITLTGTGDDEDQSIKIESPEFLSKPKYMLKGEVDKNGNIEGTYRFTPIVEGQGRKKTIKCSWEQIYADILDPKALPYNPDKSNCGPFSFEIRAWDIGSDDTQEISEKFDFQKSRVRKAIKAHKGISVYRDSILVLPKSDKARDWLGLDLRRVSKVGTRMSTSQIVGYVSISAESNPRIEDTSDRERLASCLQVAEFEEILKAVVGLLENERDEDRVKKEKEKPMEDLFADLSAEKLVEDVTALADEGADATDAIPLLQNFSNSLNTARKAIQKRFIYYSRLATVGTIAQMLVHEIRNRTTAFGSFLDFVKSRYGPFKEEDVKEEYRSAFDAVYALERLADTFSPLASRAFRRKKRDSILEERITECLSLQHGDIERKNIKCYVPETKTHVATDPGELDAILLNLISNAIYWLGEVAKNKRRLKFSLRSMNDRKRIRIWVHDTGPGIDGQIVDKVFFPGVTRRPNGIGMGLTVASELVAEYGGRMFTKHPGIKGGASFAFDLPLKR